MKHFNYKSLALGVAIVGGCAFSANADYQIDRNSIYGKQFYQEHTVRPYKGETPMTVDALFQGSDLQQDLEAQKKRVTPENTFRTPSGYDYMNGPNGTTWFYTSNVITEWLPYPDNPPEYADWFGEVQIAEYEFTIYNQYYERVGSIRDRITLEPNEKWTEKRCRDVWLDPAVSQHFFNNDDNYEVMVFHAINTEIKNYLPGNWSYSFVNRYYQKVYSINGEKNGRYDVPIEQIEGRCIDATNVAVGSGDEEFYYTFIYDGVPDFTKYVVSAQDEAYVEHVKSLISPVTTYKKAADGNGIEIMKVYDLYNTKVPGDTTEGIYLITKTKDGKGYFVYSQYELPYLVNPLGGALDETATPDNNLVISAFEISGGEATPITETKIPVEDPSTEDKLMYAFYSVGDLTYRDDVDISGALGSITAPAYIVTHAVAEAANLEAMTRNFEIYKSDGTFVRNLSDDIQGVTVLGVTNKGPLSMFIKVNDLEQITFEVTNIYTGEVIARLDQYNFGDPILANAAIAYLPDGDFNIVFPMSYFEMDAAGNSYARVAWFDSEGKKVRIDKINLGLNVEASQTYMASATMNPYLFDDDDEMEYAVLVSRKLGNDTNREEFIVVDNTGKWYALFSADDGKGDPKFFDIIPGDDKTPNRLMMAYSSGTVDIYRLPFLQEEAYEPAAVEGIIGEGKTLADIHFDGNTIFGEGCTLNVYTTNGVNVARGRNAVTVSGFENGIYVVVATDADGNSKTVKVAK